MFGNNNPEKIFQFLMGKKSESNILKYPLDVGSYRQQSHVIFDIKDYIEKDGAPLKTIQIYMPSNIKVRYGAEWENYNKIFKSTSGAIHKAQSDISGHLSSRGAANLTPEQWTGIVADKTQILTGDVSSEIAAKAGVLINPCSATLFRSIDFREFNFEFHMIPKDKDESIEIQKIIKAFKKHMHPKSIDSEAVFWEYPEVFDIQLYPTEASEPGDFLFKLANCVLKDMTVDYTSAGGQVVFYENGSPIDLHLSLTFAETRLLTQTDIDAGF